MHARFCVDKYKLYNKKFRQPILGAHEELASPSPSASIFVMITKGRQYAVNNNQPIAAIFLKYLCPIMLKIYMFAPQFYTPSNLFFL